MDILFKLFVGYGRHYKTNIWASKKTTLFVYGTTQIALRKYPTIVFFFKFNSHCNSTKIKLNYRFIVYIIKETKTFEVKQWIILTIFLFKLIFLLVLFNCIILLLVLQTFTFFFIQVSFSMYPYVFHLITISQFCKTDI